MRSGIALKSLIAGAMLSGAAVVQAASGHAAHVHGEAALNLVIDGGELMIELLSPAANLVGFEHAPHDSAEQRRVDQAEHLLRDAAAMFALPEQAQCTPQPVELHSPFGRQGHREHDHEQHPREAHAHEEHGHDEEQGHVGGHSDYEVEYAFSCSGQPPQSIRFGLFEHFPGLHEVHVQYIVDGRQGAAELNERQPVLQLR